MAHDIDRELDAILGKHHGRVKQARSDASADAAAMEEFAHAASACLANVVAPALRQMAQALNERGVAARVLADESHARIDIPVSKHARLGHGLGGYPFLRVRPDRLSRRVHFEQNASDGVGGSGKGDYALTEINAELIKAKVMDLVRELYGPA